MADSTSGSSRYKDSDIFLLILTPVLLIVLGVFLWGVAAVIIAGLILTALAMAAMLFIVAAPSTTMGPDDSH